jgi:hypothetical protein
LSDLYIAADVSAITVGCCEITGKEILVGETRLIPFCIFRILSSFYSFVPYISLPEDKKTGRALLFQLQSYYSIQKGISEVK